MHILVTGAAGFLGSHLVDAFLKEGHSVVGVDNLSSGSLQNLEHLDGNKNFHFERYDITDSILFPGYYDLVANLACVASPPKYQSDPYKTFLTSVEGISNIIKIANRSKAKIFQASTSEIYGDPTVSPQPETYFGNVNIFGPRSCYDEGKRAAETYLMLAKEKYNLEIRIARIFNTYGPRMDPYDGRVVTNFINQALRDEDITIYGDGQQTRSFCFVDDLIRGFLSLVKSDVNTPVNLGNPSERTILDLAQKIIDMTGSKSKIIHCALPIDDPTQRCPDITKARNYLGWGPKVDIQSGLEQTITYFQNKFI